jgi:putative membrane protein
MIIELSLALLFGIICGTFTGLAPGIHINLVAAFITSSVFLSMQFSPLTLVIFIVSLTITHIFIDFIPSVFLGAPNEDSFLSVLPGHQLLLEGKGFQATTLLFKGALIGSLLAILISPIFAFLLPSFYNIIKLAMPFVLILISFYMVFREEYFLTSLTIFIMAGFLGYLTFNLPIKQPLMPLLTGLFGLSSLVISLKTNTPIPKQNLDKISKIKLTKKEYLSSSLSVFLVAPFFSFLPGIGSGHAALASSEFYKTTNKSFLFMIGLISTFVMSLSFVTSYAIQKTRTGSSAAIQQLLKQISFSDILIILSTILITSIIAYLLAITVSKYFIKIMNKINYLYLTIGIISILLITNLIFTNWLGIFVLFISTSLGIFAVLSNSRRINLMSCLILPSIIYYLTI